MSLVALTIAAVGVVASILVANSIASGNARATEEWLELRGEAVLGATEGTVKSAVDALKALAAFMENSETITREEFSGFVQSLDPNVWLLGAAYTPQVAADELSDYVAARRESIPDFSVSSFDSEGNTRPVALDRAVYYPVELFHGGPVLESELAEGVGTDILLGVGFDAGSWAEWRPSLELAVSANTPAVSEFVEASAGSRTLGQVFLVVVPVHDEAGTVIGLVAAPMVDILLTTGADSALTRGVMWTVTSGGVPTQAIEGPAWARTVELPGAVWDLVATPTEGSLAEMAGTPFWLALGVGLVVTGVLVYLFLLVGQRTRTRQRVDEMERVAQERDRFLASVSHELRTPLTVVSGLAHELNDHRDDFDVREVEDLLAMLARQSDEVAAIVEDLLVAARADLGTLVLNLEHFELTAEARRVLEGVGLDASIVGGPVWAWADPSRVRQILRNLVSNAQRYGGSEQEVRIGVQDGRAWIAMADSGTPIPDTEQSQMFEAYVTSSDQRETRVGAMGLGLFISQRLAELLEGDLTYRHDGSFGIFTLSLPASPASATESAA